VRLRESMGAICRNDLNAGVCHCCGPGTAGIGGGTGKDTPPSGNRVADQSWPADNV